MSLGDLTGDGLLPPGRHRATVAELYERFVEDAPQRDSREQIFKAFTLHCELLRKFGGPSTLWVNGGFVTHKTRAPADIDYVYLCENEQHLQGMLEQDGIYALLTLQGLAVHSPVSVGMRRLQPMGGLIDCFLSSPRTFGYWDKIWSGVKDANGAMIPDRVKGYVEVQL